MERPENLKCIRCGVCCLVAPCNANGWDETGLCSYLIIHKEGYTSCKYIEEKGNTFSKGCSLRRKTNLKGVYKSYKNQAEKKVGIKLIGLNSEQNK